MEACTILVWSVAEQSLKSCMGRSLDQASPLLPGQTGPVTVTGVNFGPGCNGLPCPGARLQICPSTVTCSTSDVNAQNLQWSDNVITGQLIAGPSASGLYDVRVVTAGSTGTGFQSAPNLGTSGISRPGGPAVVTQPTTVRPLITWAPQNQETWNEVIAGACADPPQKPTISAVPAMPRVRGRLVNQQGAAVPGTATWKLTITYNYFKYNLPSRAAVTADATLEDGTNTPLDSTQPWTATLSSVLVLLGHKINIL